MIENTTASGCKMYQLIHLDTLCIDATFFYMLKDIKTTTSQAQQRVQFADEPWQTNK